MLGHRLNGKAYCWDKIVNVKYEFVGKSVCIAPIHSRRSIACPNIPIGDFCCSYTIYYVNITEAFFVCFENHFKLVLRKWNEYFKFYNYQSSL